MNRWTKYSLIAGVGLIVVVNAIVLGGVAYNRSSEPESALRLSERELAAPMRGYGNKENSGIALALNWRVLPAETHDAKKNAWAYAYNGGSPDWLNPTKMLALGFERSQSAPRQTITDTPAAIAGRVVGAGTRWRDISGGTGTRCSIQRSRECPGKGAGKRCSQA